MEEETSDDEIHYQIKLFLAVTTERKISSNKRIIPKLTNNKQDQISNNLRYSNPLNILSILLIIHIYFLINYSLGD